MGRSARLHANGCIYHVTLRGNHAAQIFDEPRDYEVLGEIVGEVLGTKGGSAHAYCWMTNHLHLLLQVGDVAAGTLMHDIAGRYSRYLQDRRKTRGHLFEGRYFAEPVTTDRYLIAAVCYIHLNPVRAGMVPDPLDYPWSGHRAYLGATGPPWLRTDLLMGSNGRRGILARSSYETLTSSPLARTMPSPFPRRPRQAYASVRTARAQLDERHRSIKQLVADACARRGLDVAELQSGAWNRQLVRLRVEIANEVHASHPVTLQGIAMELGCSRPSLARAIARHRLVCGKM